MEDDRRFRASLFDIVERMLDKILNDWEGEKRSKVITPLTHVYNDDDSLEIIFEIPECRDPRPQIMIRGSRLIMKARGQEICSKSVELPRNVDLSSMRVKNLGDLLIVKFSKVSKR